MPPIGLKNAQKKASPPKISDRYAGSSADGAKSPSGNDSRASQAPGTFIYAAGGIGYIARRGVTATTNVSLMTLDGIIRLATQQPLYLLQLLPDIVPEVGLAAWNGLRLGCGEGRVKLRAVTATVGGGSEEAPDGTAALDALFNGQSDEQGGFDDILSKNFLMLMFSGMCATEAQLAPRDQGVDSIWPVNSLTLRFLRQPDHSLLLQQRQAATPTTINLAGLSGFYVDMPMDRFFWSSMDGFPDDVYGRAPLAATLTPVMECLAFMRDFMMAFHRVGTPKLDVSFDFEMWANIAKDIVGMTDPAEINSFVQDKFGEAQSLYNSLKADDAFFHGINDKVSCVGSGDKWPDVSGFWGVLRHRLTQALKQNPVLMGVVEGSTETWSDVQWELYTEGLMSIVRKAVRPIVKIGQLHMQLLGMPYIVEAEMMPVRSLQRLNEAKAEAIEIGNEAAKVANNWQTNQTAAMNITGSAIPSAEARAEDIPPKSPAPLPVIDAPEVEDPKVSGNESV